MVSGHGFGLQYLPRGLLGGAPTSELPEAALSVPASFDAFLGWDCWARYTEFSAILGHLGDGPGVMIVPQTRHYPTLRPSSVQSSPVRPRNAPSGLFPAYAWDQTGLSENQGQSADPAFSFQSPPPSSDGVDYKYRVLPRGDLPADQNESLSFQPLTPSKPQLDGPLIEYS
ncbi:uncharacterized protein BO80DRAFT_445639 [Aspergillus ibericus CBS 121593]|uniref:Uncharacterized protein n=1 Tax=Aspergillus ibericus CBS 121593 TaxID=1448316 RepID=A0A395GYW9_9EURO|nr:hypothetical protein BO80DRAFT_445639 [Aspergillus ibericus CBS 121593]RAL00245.1 hypothetical protein BO80DRAFT_445639 [Aspergillus ibericus CBS 121593]